MFILTNRQFQQITGKLDWLIAKERKLMVDFTRLDASVTNSVALLNKLSAQIAAIPASTDPTTQAHIDGLTKTLDDAVAADTLPPAPTGVTGPAGA